MKRAERFPSACIAAILSLCLVLALCCAGCASPASQEVSTSASVDTGSGAAVEELPAQAEYEPPDPASRGKVHVRVPEGYTCSEYVEDMGPYTGREVELEAMSVGLGDAGSLQILVDDAGLFDWWYGGSIYGTTTVAEYVESATAAGRGSSWAADIGGHDGVVFIDGAADAGGEMAGQAFVFLDGTTISFSAVLPDGETAPDAYSAFFHAEEIERLLAEITISSE